MNQIMPVGRGVVIALERAIPMDMYQAFMDAWAKRLPEVPAFLINEAQIVLREDQTILFEFTGDVTPTMVAEFQRWWKEVNDG